MEQAIVEALARITVSLEQQVASTRPFQQEIDNLLNHKKANVVIDTNKDFPEGPNFQWNRLS